MKKYKFLVPIVFVVLYISSIYMIYSTKSTELEQYNEYLTLARDYRDQDIQVDAEENYKKAIDVKPSVELYIELGEFYRDSEQIRNAISCGTNILKKYPDEIKGYEFLMDIYIQRKDYVACFNLVDIIEKRKISSDVINELISSVEYEFFFNCEYEDVGIYSGGLCPVLNKGKWGYVNLTGDEVIANKYDLYGYYSGELAPVVDSDGNAYYIDINGNKKFVIQNVENIRELGLIENGIFSVFNGDTWGFYNSESQFLFGGYEEVSSIGNGIAAVMNDGKWQLLNREGTNLIGKTYDSVVMDEKKVVYRNERIFVCDNISYYMIDSNGNKISDKKYEDARVFNDSTYAAVKINNKWGYVDKEGTIVIEPEYEDARSFLNGFAAIKYAGKWGFINENGEIAITPQFEDAKDFNSSGCVFVSENGYWKLLRLYKYNH